MNLDLDLKFFCYVWEKECSLVACICLFFSHGLKWSSCSFNMIIYCLFIMLYVLQGHSKSIYSASCI